MDETFTSDGFITASISFVGFVDKLGLEGLLTLKSDDGREFPIRAFSGEVARHILRFNLYFKTRKEVITLRNYRASDSIALAAFFDVPIKVRKNLFEETIEQ